MTQTISLNFYCRGYLYCGMKLLATHIDTHKKLYVFFGHQLTALASSVSLQLSWLNINADSQDKVQCWGMSDDQQFQWHQPPAATTSFPAKSPIMQIPYSILTMSFSAVANRQIMLSSPPKIHDEDAREDEGDIVGKMQLLWSFVAAVGWSDRSIIWHCSYGLKSLLAFQFTIWLCPVVPPQSLCHWRLLLPFPIMRIFKFGFLRLFFGGTTTTARYDCSSITRVPFN